MKTAAWNRFVETRERYRREIARMDRALPGLLSLQQKLVDGRSPSYAVETPLVYNGALDDVTEADDIRMILVGDNPGRREQAAENRRYLVGPSGKIAERFFRENPDIGIDFRKNVVILNKTPIHTARTAELRELLRLGGPDLETALDDSQRFMARLLLEFQKALSEDSGRAPVAWITGYSEMKKGGVFAAYTNELGRLYGGGDFGETLFLYRHFSMNQFTIDLKQQALPGETVSAALERIGAAYRKRILF